MNWSVTIQTAGEGSPPDEDAFFDLLDYLEPYHASVTGTPLTPTDGLSRYGASLLVEADDFSLAASRALEEFTNGVAKVGLPEWPVVSFLVRTEAELDAELARPNFPVLVGISEIAELLGVSRQRASALAKGATFPRPIAALHAGPVWTESSVRRFIEGWERKSGRPSSKVPAEAETASGTSEGVQEV